MKKQSGSGTGIGFLSTIIGIAVFLVSKTARYILGGILLIVIIFVICKIAKKKKSGSAEVVPPVPPAQPAPEKSAITIEFGNSYSKRKSRDRSEKGKSLMLFPKDYCVFDLETTGFDPSFDRIVEIGALRVRSGEVVEEFHSLVNPERKISSDSIKVHGITDEMVKDAPKTAEILPRALDFIGSDIVIAHNAHFDVNFMYDQSQIFLSKPFTNDFVDTLRISKKLFPELEHHKLRDISQKLDIVPDGAHRSLADCYTLYKCFLEMEKIFPPESLDDLSKIKKRKSYFPPQEKVNLSELVPKSTDFDESNPLFGKYCAFTGTLAKMRRIEAAQAVVDAGGFCRNGVTKKTNFLITADEANEKSSKQKKAEELKTAGQDIDIISESRFYEIIGV